MINWFLIAGKSSFQTSFRYWLESDTDLSSKTGMNVNDFDVDAKRNLKVILVDATIGMALDINNRIGLECSVSSTRSRTAG